MDSTTPDGFSEVFRTEACDLIAEIETVVLDLEAVPQDTEAIHRLFRAIHTLKGSGGMMGYHHLAAYAHELETLIERLREAKTAPNPDEIRLILAAADTLHQLVADPEHPPADLPEKIRAITKASQTAGSPEEGTSGEKEATYRILFTPFPGMFAAGMDPGMLIGELREMGIFSVTANVEQLPRLETLDPELCLLSFSMTLKTTASQKDISDVFLFVAEESQIAISLVPEETPLPKVSPPPFAPPRGEGQDIRIAAPRLDTLMHLVGELMMQKARLAELAAGSPVPGMRECVEGMDRITEDLRDCALNLRMTPIAGTFSRFRRLVRDLSESLGKQVAFTIAGGETELDKAVIDGLSEPLVHLIRNSLDHGIEPPEERVRNGKSAMGELALSAVTVAGRVEIRIRDDGRGLDRDAIRKRAMEREVVASVDTLEDAEVDALIFHPGFSTAASVGTVSGRGVGMDAVKEQIEALDGRIRVDSRQGKGLTITLSLPLTLAIVDCLLVRVEGQVLVLPLAVVEECIDFDPHRLGGGRERMLLQIRGTAVPYIRLRRIFGLGGRPSENMQAVVVQVEGDPFCLVVDEVMGTQQVVIKSLGDWYDRKDGIAGATIMGDGSIALILDVQGLRRISREEEARKIGSGMAKCVDRVMEKEAHLTGEGRE